MSKRFFALTAPNLRGTTFHHLICIWIRRWLATHRVPDALLKCRPWTRHTIGQRIRGLSAIRRRKCARRTGNRIILESR